MLIYTDTTVYAHHRGQVIAVAGRNKKRISLDGGITWGRNWRKAAAEADRREQIEIRRVAG